MIIRKIKMNSKSVYIEFYILFLLLIIICLILLYRVQINLDILQNEDKKWNQITNSTWGYLKMPFFPS